MAVSYTHLDVYKRQVSDHTKNSETPFKTTALSTLTYTATSCWMYALGLGAALVTGKSEISQILSLDGVSVIADSYTHLASTFCNFSPSTVD